MEIVRLYPLLSSTPPPPQYLSLPCPSHPTPSYLHVSLDPLEDGVPHGWVLLMFESRHEILQALLVVRQGRLIIVLVVGL